MIATRPWDLPPVPEADRTPEDRGLARDEVRLLVSTGAHESDRRFRDLPGLLRPGDLLVVNESATIPASVPASGPLGDFRLSLSTEYGADLWLAEPRWGASRPGPLPLQPGDPLSVAGVPARWVAPFPGIPRLGFLRVEADLTPVLQARGRPIRYGYLAREYPLETYQTIFARVPGSAEMPSAGRPFSLRLREELERYGVRFAPILLHAGVSSLEIDESFPGQVPIYPEPFQVPAATAAAIAGARAQGGRVIAVGTTVVRALESAWDCGGVRAARGFTRLYISPDRPIRSVDGIITGFHTATSTHLALLEGLVGRERLTRAYAAAIAGGYLWHEFGDSHLLMRN